MEIQMNQEIETQSSKELLENIASVVLAMSNQQELIVELLSNLVDKLTPSEDGSSAKLSDGEQQILEQIQSVQFEFTPVNEKLDIMVEQIHMK